MTISFSSLYRDRRGNTALLAAAALPMLLGFGALAVDLGSVQLETRRLQGIADSAALAASTDPENAQQRAESMVQAAGWDRTVQVKVTTGGYSRSADKDTRFTPGADPADAVRVELTTESPTFLARVFGRDMVTISRTATATRANLASFNIGTRLVQVNDGLLNAYLSALTGSSVSLSAMDYQALASADVDLLGFLDNINTSADLRAASYDDILDASVGGSKLLDALGKTMDAGTAKDAVGRLAALTGGTGKPLSSLIDLGPLGSQDSGGSGLVRVNALSMVTALLQLANNQHQVQFDLNAAVPGLASSRVWLAIGQRPEQSPWIAITDNGQPIIRTAQARLYVENTLAPTAFPGLSGLASLNLPIYAELANGEARLDSISCGADGRKVVIDARSGLGKASIGSIDTSKLGDFSTDLASGDAQLLKTLLVEIDGHATVDLGGNEPWHQLHFNEMMISGGTPQTVSGSAAVQSLAASLASKLQLNAKAAGLISINTGPIGNAVGQQIATVAPSVDSLLNLASGALGVHYGQADVRVTGVRCGQPVLVG